MKMLARSRNGMKNTEEFSKRTFKMRRMNPQAPDFGIKEII
jgi:hypothetical protein